MESIKIKNIPINERPREKLLKYGVGSLNNNELLAVILGSGTREENVIQLSGRIIAKFNGIDNVFRAGLNDLKAIKGIGEAKASQLIALAELSNRYRSYMSEEKIRVSSPKIIFEKFGEKMRVLEKEIVTVVVLNTKKEIILSEDISVGINNSSLIHPREVFNTAIKNCGDSVIVIHNHPSGDPKPSKNDINVTIRLKECGKLLGIELIDHIIIGNRKYISLKEKGLV